MGVCAIHISIKSGATLAALAANLLLSGAVVGDEAPAAEAAKGHCIGANSCKGQSACMTAKNGCAGQNACKGQGFTQTTEAECAQVKGATFEPVSGDADKKM